jgi:hypothetical protein
MIIAKEKELWPQAIQFMCDLWIQDIKVSYSMRIDHNIDMLDLSKKLKMKALIVLKKMQNSEGFRVNFVYLSNF